MQGNYNGVNLLRNSYGYQMPDPPQIRSPPSKGFPMPNYTHNQQGFTSSIRTLENKIQGVQSLVKKKFTMNEPSQPMYPPNKHQQMDQRARNTPVFDEPISEPLLRGSCQNILRKFDYSNLRNTTHFNPINKVVTQSELRRSPQQNDNFKQTQQHLNRTVAQEMPGTFFKPGEKKYLENKHSFVVNGAGKTPPKYGTQKQLVQSAVESSRTPTKYKTILENPCKISSTSRTTAATIAEIEQKKVFRTLNEIIQNKNKQKQSIQTVKTPKKCSKILNGFELGVVLGRGKFGEVFLSRHHQTGFIAAIKKIQTKKMLEFKMVQQFTKQIRLHSCLDHPNIVKFYGVFKQSSEIYLVMEYMNGGTLFDYLNEVTCMPIKLAVEYLRDIIEALAYMHDKSIAHRDIKPENIVISSEGVAKLCDFGWSAVVETSRKTYCGTFDYAPPEILQRKNYDTSVDIWCIGVLTYQLLTGRVPFQGEKRNIIMQKIVNVDKNKIDYPVDIPPEAKEFIECLVQKDPNQRPKCHDLLKFKLFTMHLPKTKIKKLQ